MYNSKTIYPGGMNPSNSQPDSLGTQYPGMPAQNTSDAPLKPIMGFLYSVSRTPAGEYWPLYVGPNDIGSSSACSISLQEASVAERHATLVIRKMQNNGESNGILVFIQDSASTYGTMLNGVTLDFRPKECKSGDVISIGDNYELYFILIDADSLGLKTKSGFKPLAQKSVQVEEPIHNSIYSAMNKGTMPGNGSSPFVSNSKKTVYIPPQKK